MDKPYKIVVSCPLSELLVSFLWTLSLAIDTVSEDTAFSLYLGNIPEDVVLGEVWINGKRLMLASSERGVSVTLVTHVNGSRAYKLRLPFEDTDVLWKVRTGSGQQRVGACREPHACLSLSTWVQELFSTLPTSTSL